jgi:hypothetical protein
MTEERQMTATHNVLFAKLNIDQIGCGKQINNKKSNNSKRKFRIAKEVCTKSVKKEIQPDETGGQRGICQPSTFFFRKKAVQLARTHSSVKSTTPEPFSRPDVCFVHASLLDCLQQRFGS